MHFVILALVVVLTAAQDTPTSANCTAYFFEQQIDHFNWGSVPGPSQTYLQRYFVCDQHWNGGAVFFYFGNEDDVTLYVNHTGLMWENAQKFGAKLVFAEHRYYGVSLPFKDGTPSCMNWLTTEQAMADFAYLITSLRADDPTTPWIGFGGSYGGMIGSWFRIKYPYLIDGVIAASAPIWSFIGLTPPYDFYGFNKVVTYDASAQGGASDDCKNNFRAALPKMATYASTSQGRAVLATTFRTCSPLIDEADAMNLVLTWVQDPWATIAMGNFPYPSSYLLHGHGMLPAYPVREACKALVGTFSSDRVLFAAVREAVGVYYNFSHDVPCFYNGNTSRMFPKSRMMRPRHAGGRNSNSCEGDWQYQWCTEMVQPFSSGGPDDMFWPPSPFNLTASIAGCVTSYGVTPRPSWATVALASSDLLSASNIVFSNGLLDPWHPGGVLRNISDTVVAVIIPSGAHHLDLMFSDPLDPPDVIAARQVEIQHISTWIQQKIAESS